jgi:hypothetical protein
MQALINTKEGLRILLFVLNLGINMTDPITIVQSMKYIEAGYANLTINEAISSSNFRDGQWETYIKYGDRYVQYQSIFGNKKDIIDYFNLNELVYDNYEIVKIMITVDWKMNNYGTRFEPEETTVMLTYGYAPINGEEGTKYYREKIISEREFTDFIYK